MATATETPWRNRIVASAEVDPATLTANPRNWRTHPSRQKAALRGALGSVGWVQQVIVNRVTGHVVDGHARIEEALARGESRVPVLYVEIAPEEEALVLATLDPLGAMAEADTPKLNELLAGISVDDAGLRLLLGSLSGPEERREGLTDPDDVPSLASSTDLQTGELWQLGHHRLLIGDATSAPDVARVVGEDLVDMIWTDPPYGVDYEGGTEDKLRIANDALDGEGTRDLVATALRLAPLRAGGCFYLASPAGPMSLEFAGSGTTLIACEQLGRRGLALEIDPRYAQVIIERWEAFTGGKAERLDG